MPYGADCGKGIFKGRMDRYYAAVNWHGSTSFADFATVPADLMSVFQLIPYASAEDAVFKALGVE